ncbi:MAG: hypothetical protein JWN13_3760 [Betaproteobacteria bacterium]|jgi:hypothetical protein|nr:hypothetical protein [Betaproteobacteria bacterium]MEA3152862.1 hypothetical protein [Betaproteobacteria bacterium]
MVQQGIPAVGLIHKPFEKLAKMQAVQLGMPDAPLLIYSQDLPSKDPADFVQKKAEDVSEQVVELLISQCGAKGQT